MKKNDKRGISAIVATVLIIGITVGVIAIVGNFIIGMVNENLQEGTLCSKAATEVLIKTSDGLTCYNGTEVRVQVARGAGDLDLKGIIIYQKVNGSDVNATQVDAPDTGLTKVLRVPIAIKTPAVPATGEDSAVSAVSYTEIDAIAIAAVVGIGESGKTCGKSQYVNVPKC
ncbi:hypothetical protein HN747_02110 [archaeon]|jgi:FlaG/FlaF family flagellin (archaellin)|nr:hypothetical protein [archaeon]